MISIHNIWKPWFSETHSEICCCVSYVHSSVDEKLSSVKQHEHDSILIMVYVIELSLAPDSPLFWFTHLIQND